MRKNDLREIKNQIIYTLLEKKGKVIFPSFACDRQENLLVYIKQIIDGDERLKDIDVEVDGKLSSKVIGVYSNILTGTQKDQFYEILNWKNLIINESFEQSKTTLMSDKPMVILSSSGMCEAGRIKQYLIKCLPDKKNTIIFTGFAPISSIAGKIKSREQATIKIDEATYDIRADVVCCNSFSSHMQKEQLLSYCMNMNVSDKYIFVHGNKECKEEIVNDLKQELMTHNKTTTVIGSKKGMTIYF
jgi:metallo-beta-lactamase family protein